MGKSENTYFKAFLNVTLDDTAEHALASLSKFGSSYDVSATVDPSSSTNSSVEL